MHVLTKVFTVLVALLAIALVPLVVVYAKNENTYKAKYEQTQQHLTAANASAQRAERSLQTETQRLQDTINHLTSEIGNQQRQVAERNAQIARLQSDIATSRQTQAQIAAKISGIDSQLASAQDLIKQLVTEASEQRNRALAAERANALLEVANREQFRDLEIANSAVRALQIEVQRLSEANGRAMDKIGRYTRLYPDIDDRVSTARMGVPIDTPVTAKVVDARVANGVMMVEIDAGQRDGVKVGWEMTLTDGASEYLGNLRIISVDMNRATGIAEKPNGDPAAVAIGHSAVATPY